MSGRIPQHFIDDLLARTDLVELVGSRVPLKKAGKEYKACCPFHDEKTPSFAVVPDKQFYHCFGCGAHGTALTFLMEYDHLNFIEAVEELAGKLGLEIPRPEEAASRTKSQDDPFTVLEQATEFFRQQLRNAPAAVEYLKNRGVAGETAVQFGIGFAPNAWDTLLRHLGATDDARRKLLHAGLIIERERRSAGEPPGYYDRFRHRIMFPIRDARGRTIAFGGRVIQKEEPKYLNSPETELFHKGRELYGLYEARQATRNLERLMVVEGYMDVVSLHQAGVTYAVATLGTATTAEHLKRLFRVCGEVVFCFDGDRAGRGAAWRALETCLPEARQGRQVRFLFLPDGHDPDSLVKEEGRDAFEHRLRGALSLSDYLIGELKTRHDLAAVDGRAAFANAAQTLLARVTDNVYRELLLEQVAASLTISTDRLRRLLVLPQAAQPSMEKARGAMANAAISSGRGSLVRQAIQNLLHYPQVAPRLSRIAELSAVNRPGITLLLQLVEELRECPDLTPAALLERWRGRPDFHYIDKLFLKESLAVDTNDALEQVQSSIDRVISENFPEERFDELMHKYHLGALSTEEKAELRELTQRQARPGTGRQNL